ncbi:dihydrodipicolinate synthase family protein [Lichenicola sp.]|uniref:dihydrodipicolinate synthase family protein n=1 Tax=Lichenicola sp. TaxID=2804529 RepID=UPI003B0100E0
MKTITGLSAFPITPVDEAGVVDTETLQRLLARLVAAGVDSIGLLGSTGSYAYLTRAERLRAIEAAVECVAGRVPLLVGIGALRTDEASELARDALRADVQMGLLAPVSYVPLQEHEVFEHFQAVSEVGLPLCIYNNPGTTHFSFTPELVGRLAELPNIVAVKNPAPGVGEIGDLHADLLARVPSDFSLGYSVDWHAGQALLAGGDAWYSALAGLYPDIALRLTRAAQGGRTEEVAQLNRQLEPVWRLFRAYSSYRVMHLAASREGFGEAQPIRPVLPLADEAARDVETVLERSGLT